MALEKLYNILLSIMLICLVIAGIFAFFVIKSYLFKVFFFAFLLITFISFVAKEKALAFSDNSRLTYAILMSVMSILVLSFVFYVFFILGRFTISHIF